MPADVELVGIVEDRTRRPLVAGCFDRLFFQNGKAGWLLIS
jgi:hypothetical protein